MKDICLKYGNPDGPGSVRVGVALPSWMMRKGSNNFTLLLLFGFVALMLGLPAYYLLASGGGDSKYDEFGIHRDNQQIF